MSVPEVIKGEATEMGRDLELREPAPMNLFRTEDPDEVIAKATATANALKAVVDAKNLTKDIQGKAYVLVDGWTLLGTMLGVFPICVWTRPVHEFPANQGSPVVGWEARVEARTLAGAVVGAAEAQCTRSENLWKSRDDYALRSMAQTRATSKALRQPLGFVMTLAGFAETPAEEMPKAENTPRASKEQRERLGAILKHLETNAPKAEGQLSWGEDAQTFMREQFNTDKSAALSPTEMDTLISYMEGLAKDEAVPFF